MQAREFARDEVRRLTAEAQAANSQREYEATLELYQEATRLDIQDAVWLAQLAALAAQAVSMVELQTSETAKSAER